MNYQSFPSAVQPVVHNNGIAIPEFKELPDHKELTDGDNDINEDFASLFMLVLFDQQNLSGLIRDLSLSKESSEVLTPQLKDQNLLLQGTKITFCRTQMKRLCLF